MKCQASITLWQPKRLFLARLRLGDFWMFFSDFGVRTSNKCVVVSKSEVCREPCSHDPTSDSQVSVQRCPRSPAAMGFNHFAGMSILRFVYQCFLMYGESRFYNVQKVPQSCCWTVWNAGWIRKRPAPWNAFCSLPRGWENVWQLWTARYVPSRRCLLVKMCNWRQLVRPWMHCEMMPIFCWYRADSVTCRTLSHELQRCACMPCMWIDRSHQGRLPKL